MDTWKLAWTHLSTHTQQKSGGGITALGRHTSSRFLVLPVLLDLLFCLHDSSAHLTTTYTAHHHQHNSTIQLCDPPTLDASGSEDVDRLASLASRRRPGNLRLAPVTQANCYWTAICFTYGAAAPPIPPIPGRSPLIGRQVVASSDATGEIAAVCGERTEFTGW